MDDHYIERMKGLLLMRKEELHTLTGSDAQDSEPVILDQQRVGRLSRMDAMQVQAMIAETNRRRSIELSRVETALGRISAGDYGYCVKCDEEISEKRLEVDPASIMCIACAELSERR